MELDELERLEQTTHSMVVQALVDYKDRAAGIFRNETDEPQDITEGGAG